MLRSDLCDYSDAYIVEKGTITVEGDNNASFRSCIWKINKILIDNAKDFDNVMPIYNLLEYSDDYCMTSGSLWNYCRHQINDSPIEINNCNRKNNKKTTTSKSFEYKTKLIGGAPNNNNILDAEVSIIPRPPENLGANPSVLDVEAIQRTSATFQINNAKHYVLVVTLSVNRNIKFLEKI